MSDPETLEPSSGPSLGLYARSPLKAKTCRRIGQNACVEEQWVLKDDRQRTAQGRGVGRRRGLPKDCDCANIWLPQQRRDMEEGRLAGSIGSDQCQRLAWIDSELVYIEQRSGIAADGDIVKREAPERS